MTYPSLRDATELQRIIKATTGREASLREVYRIWHYFNKVLLCSGLWRENKEPVRLPAQLDLF